MARTKTALLALLLVLPAVSCGTPCSAMDKNLQEAISAYNERDYATAISLLEKADQKDSLVRYYLALSYQGAGNFQGAESEYRWGVAHASNKDLKYKSWQGLQGIQLMNKNRKSYISGYVPKALAASGQSTQPMDLATSMDNFRKINKVDIKVDYRAGCPRHY